MLYSRNTEALLGRQTGTPDRINNRSSRRVTNCTTGYETNLSTRSNSERKIQYTVQISVGTVSDVISISIKYVGYPHEIGSQGWYNIQFTILHV